MKKIIFIVVFIFLWAYASKVDMALRAQGIPSTETYTDKKGEVYQVYIGKRGGKYILRKSKTTGKTYKYYLPKKK